MRKKTVALWMVSAMCLAMAACGSEAADEEKTADAEQTETSIANPITEVTEEELIEKTGIDLQAPEGAENVVYSVIDGDPVIAQMDYTFEGHDLTERACMTSLLSLTGEAMSDPDASLEDLTDIDFDAANISGLYYDFTMGGTQLVSYCEALDQRSEEGPCYIAWLDAVPGILYNLSCNDALDDEELVYYAESVFLPMQGDSDGEEDVVSDTEEEAGEQAADGSFSYASLANQQFIFSSGVGAWQTTLNIAADGSFTGYYSDSDMGDTGDDYPDGTVYECSFSGQFGELVQLDDLTYMTTIVSCTCENESGTEAIIDGIKYVYSDPYGLDDAQDIYFYLPGTQVSSLSGDAHGWLSSALYDYENDTEMESINFYALYNENTGEAFSSYEAE